MICYVYVIAVKDEEGNFCAPVKVGISNSPRARLAQLLTGSHTDMGLVHAFLLPDRDIASAVECAFHTVKAANRKRGEWFDVDPATALLHMCINIDSCMSVHVGCSDEETTKYWEMIGWPYQDKPYHPKIFRSQ